jgi:hypothetical protein
MLGKRKLILDTFCEVYDLLKPWADGEFWDFKQHTVVSGALYVIGREQFKNNIDSIKKLVNNQTIFVVFSNPAEGSETLARHCELYGADGLIKDQKILLVGGGDMDPSWPCLQFDSFLPKILDYNENQQAIKEYGRQSQTDRPYKFLFLNGRYRSHRQYLLKKLEPWLEHSIWSNLDSRSGPIKLLSEPYELSSFLDNQVDNQGFVKHQRFNGIWGEIYLRAEPYLDTYFSLVTETVFDYPYSFRTEKIWKPIAMGHPFLVVANAGYYRDLHRLGFKTFGHVIDESFDLIDDNQARLDRIVAVIEDLCRQNLASFLEECYNVCKYNQQHLAQMSNQVRQDFPERFQQFIKKYHFNE